MSKPAHFCRKRRQNHVLFRWCFPKRHGKRSISVSDGKGDNVSTYASSLVASEPSISAISLAGKIVTMAYKNDNYKARDDISCATIYFRDPSKLLICTGPPYEKDKDQELALKVLDFKGKVIYVAAQQQIS